MMIVMIYADLIFNWS